MVLIVSLLGQAPPAQPCHPHVRVALQPIAVWQLAPTKYVQVGPHLQLGLAILQTVQTLRVALLSDGVCLSPDGLLLHLLLVHLWLQEQAPGAHLHIGGLPPPDPS